MKLAVGDSIPEWEMASVSPERMRTMAAILRDPNPLHWDRDAVDALPLGLGKRTINQGPLGLSYIINMLQAWGGPDCLRRIVMRFPQVVLDGERVVARGEISVLPRRKVYGWRTAALAWSTTTGAYCWKVLLPLYCLKTLY